MKVLILMVFFVNLDSECESFCKALDLAEDALQNPERNTLFLKSPRGWQASHPSSASLLRLPPR